MKETLKEQAYTYIKTKIIHCDYPPGMFLNEEQLRTELAISRTPIRDAISRLEQENLVRVLPKKGILVSELPIREIQSIFETRLLVEPYALLNYGNSIPQSEYQKYLEVFSDNSLLDPQNDTIYDMDSQFHHMIVEATQNPYLIQMYGLITAQNTRLRILSGGENTGRLHQTQEEHLAILKCCLAQDWQGASQKMRKHLEGSQKASFDLAIKNVNLKY